MYEDGIDINYRESIWIDALRRKEHDVTDEEYEYEMQPQVLYEDSLVVFSKEYWVEYRIALKDTNRGSSFSSLEQAIAERLENWSNDENLKGKTLLEYIREKDFPMNFKLWE